MNIVQLPIEKWASPVRLKPNQMKRDVRRGGATSRAAARLALWRLRTTLRREGLTMVSDIDLSVHEDYIRDSRVIHASVRVVRPPAGVDLPDPYMVPPDRHRLAVVVPSEMPSLSHSLEPQDEA